MSNSYLDNTDSADSRDQVEFRQDFLARMTRKLQQKESAASVRDTDGRS